jgi:excisionase family DNA binding protein
MTNDQILTIAGVAQLLKVAEKTVYVLAQRREIPAFKVGGQWRFSGTALDAWIAEQSKAHRTEETKSPERSVGSARAGRRRRR